MRFKALLFDLDGTLIDFDFRLFIKSYLSAAAKHFYDLIPDSNAFMQELLKSTDVMENNNTANMFALEDFLNDFCPKFEADCKEIEERFHSFYSTDFEVIRPLITKIDGSLELIHSLKEHFPEMKLVIATNPVFPFIAVSKRMEWGGIPVEYFDYITHAENSRYCKFNDKYWVEILKKIGCKPEETLMVGNDAVRDMSAKKIGCTTFLVDQTTENEEHMTEEIKPDYRGTLHDLKDLIFSPQ